MAPCTLTETRKTIRIPTRSTHLRDPRTHYVPPLPIDPATYLIWTKATEMAHVEKIHVENVWRAPKP